MKILMIVLSTLIIIGCFPTTQADLDEFNEDISVTGFSKDQFSPAFCHTSAQKKPTSCIISIENIEDRMIFKISQSDQVNTIEFDTNKMKLSSIKKDNSIYQYTFFNPSERTLVNGSFEFDKSGDLISFRINKVDRKQDSYVRGSTFRVKKFVVDQTSNGVCDFNDSISPECSVTIKKNPKTLTINILHSKKKSIVANLDYKDFLVNYKKNIVLYYGQSGKVSGHSKAEHRDMKITFSPDGVLEAVSGEIIESDKHKNLAFATHGTSTDE